MPLHLTLSACALVAIVQAANRVAAVAMAVCRVMDLFFSNRVNSRTVADSVCSIDSHVANVGKVAKVSNPIFYFRVCFAADMARRRPMNPSRGITIHWENGATPVLRKASVFVPFLRFRPLTLEAPPSARVD